MIQRQLNDSIGDETWIVLIDSQMMCNQIYSKDTNIHNELNSHEHNQIITKEYSS